MLGKCYVLSECTYLTAGDEGFVANGHALDYFFRNLKGPKYFSCEYSRESFRPPPSATTYFKSSEINNDVRSYVREFVPQRHLMIYDNAYINTDAGFAAMFKLYIKLRGVPDSTGAIITKLHIPEPTFKLITTSFIDVAGLLNISVPITFTRETFLANPFKSSSGMGADYYVEPPTGTKGHNFPSYRERMAWIASKLASGEKPEDFLPPWFHIIMPKGEVRSPEVDRDKIRLIWMQNMEVGGISKHFTAPLQQALCKTYWYMPGKGLMGYMLPWMFMGLGLPYLRTFVPNYQPINPLPPAYLLLDLSGQDLSYTGRLMFVCAFCCLIMYEPPLNATDPIVNICAYMFAYTLVKLAHFWGDKKYYTCVFASGSDWTTIFDTIMNYFCVWATIWLLCERRFLDPVICLRSLRIISYGDDTTLSGPPDLMGTLFSDMSDFCEIGRECVGVVFKPEQSFFLPPIVGHKHRFFTHLTNDTVVSPGVCMLQRYWVKYSRDLVPLHPDCEDYHCILPWRPTKDIVPKIGLDVNNWKSGSRPWVAWYQKAFGLLIDSVVNRESHDMIISAMESVRTLYPDQVEDAETSFSWELHANVFKLGKEFDNSLIKSLPRSPLALKVIAMLFVTRQYHITTMFPNFSGLSYDQMVSGSFN